MARSQVNSYKKEGDYDSVWLAGGHWHAEEYIASISRGDHAIQDTLKMETVFSSEC